MEQQPATPSKSVLISAIFLVVAGVALAAAFYYFDGVKVVSDFIAEQFATRGQNEVPSRTAARTAAPADELRLPAGMPKEFALRIWQEQVESQRVITRLVEGDVKALEIADVDIKGDVAILPATVIFKDGSSTPGSIGMRRYAGVWYIAYASAQRNGGTAETSEAELPSLEEIDVPSLNTIMAEQLKSKAITQEYVDGKISRVDVGEIKPGANVVSIGLHMQEDHENSYGDVVAIKQKVAGKELWFLTRFNKTGSDKKM